MPGYPLIAAAWPAVWEDGGTGDPSDRAAGRPEALFPGPPPACNTWSENTYQNHCEAL